MAQPGGITRRQSLEAASVRTLIAFTVLNHIAFGGSRVAAALAGLKLNASPFAIGLVLSFYSLLPMILSVPAGRWIDRSGIRTPMLAGTGLLAAGVVVPFVAWDIGSLYLASVCIGTGFMSYHLCMQKAAGDIGGAERRSANFGLLALGFSISGFLGPTVTGLMIDHGGHRVVFGLLAVLPLLALIGLLRYPFHARLLRRHSARVAPTEPGKVADLLRDPQLRRLYVAVAAISSSWDIHQFLVPLYGASIGLSASSIGAVLGGFAAATFVIRLALPVIARRLSEWTLILYAMFMAAAVFALYPFFPGFGAMLALSFALGLGLGVSQPLIMSLLHTNAPKGRAGEAAGLRMTMINGSQTVLPTTLGALGGMFGLAPLFLGMSAVVIGAVGYAMRGSLLRRRGSDLAGSDEEGLL